LFQSTIGTMLPLIDENKKQFHVLTIANYKLKEPYYVNAILSNKNGHNSILKFNANNINMIMNELLHVNYGWGGLYNQRDCSSTLRDFFCAVWNLATEKFLSAKQGRQSYLFRKNVR